MSGQEGTQQEHDELELDTETVKDLDPSPDQADEVVGGGSGSATRINHTMGSRG